MIKKARNVVPSRINTLTGMVMSNTLDIEELKDNGGSGGGDLTALQAQIDAAVADIEAQSVLITALRTDVTAINNSLTALTVRVTALEAAKK